MKSRLGGVEDDAVLADVAVYQGFQSDYGVFGESDEAAEVDNLGLQSLLCHLTASKVRETVV